jgi:hypothetical protein
MNAGSVLTHAHDPANPTAESCAVAAPAPTTHADVPSWLVGCVGPSASRVQQPRRPRAETEIPTAVGCEIDEPEPWEFNGDLTRRVAVYDHNFTPPRVVRRCGHKRCLRCREPFWSPDVRRIQLCDPCKVMHVERDPHAAKPGPKPGFKHPYRNYRL